MINVQDYTFTLSANGTYRMPVGGKYFKILAATGAVSVRGSWGSLSSLVVGQGISDTEFQELTFTDKSGASNTITVVVGEKDFVDGATGSVQVIANKVPQSGSYSNAQANITMSSAQLLAANAARQYFLLQNNDPSAFIYVGFGAAAVTAANGVRIIPGGNLELSGSVTTQQINVIGSAVTSAAVVVQG